MKGNNVKMITDTFDIDSLAIISPDKTKQCVHADICLTCFSQAHIDYAIEKYSAKLAGQLMFSTGNVPVYIFNYNDTSIVIFRSYIGGPAATGGIEDITELIDTEKFVMFGSCGCLVNDINFGKIIIPDKAYRDEGTSYHYAKPADFIDMPGHTLVKQYMSENNIDYICGSTWTTDAFYRETKNNFKRRRAEGCICVEMEAASVQAMCDFRGYDLYCFLYGSDMLDADEWSPRTQDKKNLSDIKNQMMDLGVELSAFIVKRSK